MAIGILIVGALPHGGADAFYHVLIREAAVVVAADAGLELCLRAERMPDLVVGDFDSVDPVALARAREAGAEIVRFPAEKDATDLDLALDAVMARYAGPVAFTAVLGARLDHTLGALGTLMRGAVCGSVTYEPDVTVHALDASSFPELALHESHGTTISVLPVGGRARITLEGFRYDLADFEVQPLSSLGVSNIAREAVQRVKVSAGQVFVLVQS